MSSTPTCWPPPDQRPVAQAVLDVLQQEPLPAAHSHWMHERVTPPPHEAAQTDARGGGAGAAANLRVLRDGSALRHQVDRGRGQ